MAALTIGFRLLAVHANTAGVPAAALPRWPGQSGLSRQSGLSTLVVFAHPRCPCSRATLYEIERLLPALRGRARVAVVFVRPAGTTLSWAQEDLWQKARALPGVDVTLDEGGREAARFGAKTSGQVFFFDAGGVLVFQGGITPARGHSGDSVGRAAILAFVENGKRSPASTSKAFGCSLSNPELSREGERL